jgi:serine/threonine protein kinase
VLLDNGDLTEAFERTDAADPDATTVEDLQARAEARAPAYRVGPYLLVKKLGGGSQGSVWLALRTDRTSRRVALKVSASQWADETSRERLLKEFQRSDKVIHPAILPVYDFGVIEPSGHAYMAMRLVEGFTLGQMISQRRKHLAGQTPEELHRLAILPDAQYVPAIIALTLRLAEALQKAHDAQIIHRDIKPSNVLLDQNGESYLSDFGLALDLEKSTSWGSALAGTLPYMAPERFVGNVESEERCDVYSLGVTLYEATTLHRPHDPKGQKSFHSWTTYWTNHAEAPRPRVFRPGLPRDLEAVILKAIDPVPSRRYDSARKLAEELGRIQRNEPAEARTPGWVERQTRRLERHRRSLAVLALALLVVILSGTLAAWFRKNRLEATAFRNEAEQWIAVGEFDRARDLLARAQSLGPDDPENQRIGDKLARASFVEIRDAVDARDPARARTLLAFHRSLLPRDASTWRLLNQQLGLRRLPLASDPPGAEVTFHAVRPDGRPRLERPLVTDRAGSASQPNMIEDVAPGAYWVTAIDPSSKAFIELPYQVEHRANPGARNPTPVFRLRTPPSGMVLVPGGTLSMGDSTLIRTTKPDDKGPAGYDFPAEFPVHNVEVPGFLLDPTEVTNAEFEQFLKETGHDDWRKDVWPRTGMYPKDQADWPVTGLSPDMAAEFAAWYGCRLPTEAELEWAARGKEGRRVPPGVPPGWKPEGPSWSALHPVRSEPIDRVEMGGASIFGLYGNAGEMTLFRFRPYPNPGGVRVRLLAWEGFATRCGLFPVPGAPNGPILLGYVRRASRLPDSPHPLMGFRRARSLQPWAQTPSVPIPSSE